MIILVDMNSFFASVEQQANPFFRGKPVGVCPASTRRRGEAGASLHETSCLIAASKEAKALGVKTGTLIYKAKKICPEIILLRAEPEKYREVNRRIVKIFRDYTDRVEVYSIDEAFLEIKKSKGKSQNIGNPLVIGAEIKQRIRREVGEWLTCSVGIAPNKFMAKLACDLKKPDGLGIVWRENLPEIYKTKKLRDLWGISYGWERRLAKLGITSPLQLLDLSIQPPYLEGHPPRSALNQEGDPPVLPAAQRKTIPMQNLISLFGKPGFYLWQRVNGLEEDTIEASDFFSPRTTPPGATRHPPLGGEGKNPKSFGHSRVLNFRATDKERLKPVILRLAEKAARRMRVAGFGAHGFYLSIRMVNGGYLAKSKKLKFTIDTGLELYEQAVLLWKNWQFPADVMHIAVGFMDLAPKVNQLELFGLGVRIPPLEQGRLGGVDPKNWDLGGELTAALDLINSKYGEFTIRSGLLTNSSDYAP